MSNLQRQGEHIVKYLKHVLPLVQSGRTLYHTAQGRTPISGPFIKHLHLDVQQSSHAGPQLSKAKSTEIKMYYTDCGGYSPAVNGKKKITNPLGMRSIVHGVNNHPGFLNKAC